MFTRRLWLRWARRLVAVDGMDTDVWYRGRAGNVSRNLHDVKIMALVLSTIITNYRPLSISTLRSQHSYLPVIFILAPFPCNSNSSVQRSILHPL